MLLQLVYSSDYGEHLREINPFASDGANVVHGWCNAVGDVIESTSPEIATEDGLMTWMHAKVAYNYSPRYWYALVECPPGVTENARVVSCAYFYSGPAPYELHINPAGALAHLVAHKLPSLDYTDTPIQPTNESPTMINLNLKREDGRLVLYVNAKELHDDLDAIGVSYTGDRYNNQPAASHSIADARTMTLSSNVLLTRKYPHKVDLTGVFVNPPSYANLKKLCESAHDQTRKILEHYQPIDISVEIHKKLVG